jgi:hypothetical protein
MISNDEFDDRVLKILTRAAREPSEWLDRHITDFLVHVDEVLRVDTWRRAIRSGDPTWERFCAEHLGVPAAFVEHIREARRLLDANGHPDPPRKPVRS